MKRIIILGVTGTIGQQALEVINKKELLAATYFKNHNFIDEIKNKYFNTKFINLNNNDLDLNKVQNLINKYKPTIVLNAISGWEGLKFSKLILENKIDLALANKESLVLAGELLINLAKQNKVKIYPVDSEHSSLYELMKIDNRNIEKIYITASGGRYFESDLNKLDNVKFNEVIKHPNWNMGEQISIDSSTLINKFYELVEASYLFGDKYDIVPIRHKQSLVHSIIKYKNNSYLFNVSDTDMKISIDLALNKFKKQNKKIKEINFNNLNLSFNIIDENKFLAIKWFYEFKNKKNKLIPIIVNITNEFCFELFKQNKIKFIDIINIIQKTLINFKTNKLIKTWDDIYDIKKELTSFLVKEFNYEQTKRNFN